MNISGNSTRWHFLPERAELQTYNAKYFARGRREMSDYKNFYNPICCEIKAGTEDRGTA